MLICSLPMKSGKRLAHNIIYTPATYSRLIHDITDRLPDTKRKCSWPCFRDFQISTFNKLHHAKSLLICYSNLIGRRLWCSQKFMGTANQPVRVKAYNTDHSTLHFVTVWNNLSQSIRHFKSISSFKPGLKTHLLKQWMEILLHCFVQSSGILLFKNVCSSVSCT